jgi:hypothetical protein
VNTVRGTTSFARRATSRSSRPPYSTCSASAAHHRRRQRVSLVLEVPITDTPARAPPGRQRQRRARSSGSRLASRPRVRFLRDERDWDHYGNFAQVSRLGWPLINEVIIPLQDKDKFNRTSPRNDVANFGQYILDPEVPKLLNLVLHANCAATPAGGRTDISASCAQRHQGSRPAPHQHRAVPTKRSRFNSRALMAHGPTRCSPWRATTRQQAGGKRRRQRQAVHDDVPVPRSPRQAIP